MPVKIEEVKKCLKRFAGDEGVIITTKKEGDQEVVIIYFWGSDKKFNFLDVALILSGLRYRLTKGTAIEESLGSRPFIKVGSEEE